MTNKIDNNKTSNQAKAKNMKEEIHKANLGYRSKQYDNKRQLFFFGYNFINTNSKEFGTGNTTIVEFRDYDKGTNDLQYFQKKYPNAKWWISTKYCQNWLEVRENSDLVSNEKDDLEFNYIKRK